MYPEASITLDRLKIERNKYIGFDLLEIEWNYLNQIGEEVFNALNKYDVWSFSLEKYIDLALDKWIHFKNEITKESSSIILVDSSIFQYQIYTFLLERSPVEYLKNFIKDILTIISDLNPLLIYFYRENVEETISFLNKKRGEDFFIEIYNRDKHLPYYQDKPSGVDGYTAFLRDYNHIANQLYTIYPYPKIGIEISNGDWKSFTQKYLDCFNLQFNLQIIASNTYQGIFINNNLDKFIEVNGLTITDPNGHLKKLIPKSTNEFYIENLPVILKFKTPNKIVIEGEQLIDRWTTFGTEFIKKN